MATKRKTNKRSAKAKPPTKTKPRRRVIEVELEASLLKPEPTAEERQAVAMASKATDWSELRWYASHARGERGKRLRDWMGWQMACESTPRPDA